MTTIIEKYYSKEDIEQVAKQNKYNSEYYNEFIWFLNLTLTELEQDNAIDEEEDIAELLKIPIEYTNLYAQKRNEGFSIPWSKMYAEKKIDFDTRNLLMWCYEATEEIDKEQAHNDLMTYCKLTGRSQFFVDNLLLRMKNGERFGEESIEKVVEEFEVIYDEQRAKGKSELYAYQYADYIIDDYHPIFCEDYAFIYEESINIGKSKEYASEYAYKYASELVDVKRRYGISEDEEALDFAKTKAIAYINGWEYAKANNLKNWDLFIRYYENAFLNTYYPDNPKDLKSIEECKTISAKEAMEVYLKTKE